MAWRAAKALITFHEQLKAGAPKAAPPATGADEWGLIGDAAHDPTSDHSPHNFPGWGNQIVTAADFPNRPDLGLDAHKVLDDIRRSKDPRVKYGISNGQMFSSYAVSGYAAWTWRPYNPSNGDKHFTHGHLSVVGDSRSDGTQPWVTIGAQLTAAVAGEDDDMGASFGPIEIRAEGVTSLTLPPVQAGIADPRPAWVNFCNDTNGDRYGMRVWYTVGNGAYSPLPGWDSDGKKVLRSGVRESVKLPASCSGLAISRVPLDSSNNLADEGPVYAGHLTLAIERGAVGSAG